MASARVALDGCQIDHALDGAVEIVEARPSNRSFPDRITPSLGICLKIGPAHDVRADGRQLRYPAGSICVRPPGCVWSSAATGPVGFLSLDLDRDALPQGPVHGRMTFVPPAAVPRLAAQIATLRATGTTVLQKQTVVTDLVNDLHAQQLIAAEQLRGEAPPRTTRRARELLEARLTDPPSLDELARLVGANRFLVLRHFRRFVGVTPHAFVLQLRVARAKTLLARGQTPIEVAYALGFADQSHFTRVFGRIVGLAPGRYRRQARLAAAVPRSISFKSARRQPR
jgi:AraC-like DNA-binding protein